MQILLLQQEPAHMQTPNKQLKNMNYSKRTATVFRLCKFLLHSYAEPSFPARTGPPANTKPQNMNYSKGTATAFRLWCGACFCTNLKGPGESFLFISCHTFQHSASQKESSTEDLKGISGHPVFWLSLLSVFLFTMLYCCSLGLIITSLCISFVVVLFGGWRRWELLINNDYHNNNSSVVSHSHLSNHITFYNNS